MSEISVSNRFWAEKFLNLVMCKINGKEIDSFSMSKSSKTWEYYAQNETYWSVLTFEEYTKKNLNDKQLKKFFETGEKHIQKVFKLLEVHLDRYKQA